MAPDTNVVAAASIIANVEGGGQVKHVFYDESIQLFSLFAGPVRGYILPRVRSECYRILSSAVRDAYARGPGAGRPMGRGFYRDVARAVHASEIRMRRLIARLERPRLDAGRVASRLAEVRRMSRDLRDRHRKEYSDRRWREREARARAGPVMTSPDWRKVQKGEAYRMYLAQIACESLQLARFAGGHPNASDQQILAEAAALADTLAGKGTAVMIASLDTGFFSPYYSRGGRSDLVTEEIRRRFGITCGRPRAVFLMAGGPRARPARAAGRRRASAGGRRRAPGAGRGAARAGRAAGPAAGPARRRRR